MKVAIIILGNTWVCPYVNTYKRFFEKAGVCHDVILWDRDGSDSCAPIRFCSGKANLSNPLSKAVSYVRYARFIKKTIVENGYDRLVVSGPHLAILLSSFLRKNFKNRYIVDYRDISVEQRFLFSYVYSKTLASSYCNVISSYGFKKYLPCRFNYLISHNFDMDRVLQALKNVDSVPPSLPLKILTIGSIRNFDSNVKVLDALANKDDYRLLFSGRGEASSDLEEYSLEHDIRNVEFTGFYKKDDEPDIVSGSSLINIFFPDNVEHSSIMSNRFYLALIYKKPMIVTAGSTQAEFVRKYGLGVVVENCENLDCAIKEYVESLDYGGFCGKCNELLELFVQEHRHLEEVLRDFTC